MPDQTVHAEQTGRVLTVRLDNPPRNFMTTRMVHELDRLVRALESDRSVGAVVLTGAVEDVFITHFDVEEILRGTERGPSGISAGTAGGGLRAVGAIQRLPGGRSLVDRSPVAGVAALLQLHDVFDRMSRLDKVFIAAINGLCLGGGCELALACDIRLIADGDHLIGLPEMTVGIIPGGGGTQRLARSLGPARALEMMLEGRTLAPREAQEVGLVHHVVDADALLDRAGETASRLARRSPVAVAALKRAVYEGGSMPLGAGLHVERAGFLAASSAPPAKRAMQAYVEQVRRLGDIAPWQARETMAAWQEGTEVDLAEA
jgi:enoyl-CoA hydratase